MQGNVGKILLGFGFFLLAVVIAKLNDATKGKGRKDGKTRPSPAESRTPAWLWVVLIGIVACITFLIRPSKPGAGVAQAPPGLSPRILVAVVIAPVGIVALLILFAWIRHRDPLISRAVGRANEGDIDGGIAELREAIESGRAKPQRWNALGCLLLQKEEAEEALKAFLVAEDLGGRQPIFLANRGVALRKLGRPEEAVLLFEEVCAKSGQDPFPICNYVLTLADLGRWDEAREQLARAEELIKTRIIPASIQRAREASVRECRDRLEPKAKPGGLAGLDEF